MREVNNQEDRDLTSKSPIDTFRAIPIELNHEMSTFEKKEQKYKQQ